MPTHCLRFALLTSAMLLLGACSATGPNTGASTSSAALSPAGIADIVASPDRSEADRRNDLRRKPLEMLAFIGVRPGIVALDVSAGGGYTTELLARSAGLAGRVYAQTPPPRANRPAPAQPEGAAAPVQGLAPLVGA